METPTNSRKHFNNYSADVIDQNREGWGRQGGGEGGGLILATAVNRRPFTAPSGAEMESASIHSELLRSVGG